jgi:hypothetical protein
MRNTYILGKFFREDQNTSFVLNNLFFKNRAVYEIMRNCIVEADTPQMTIWRISIACWILKATNTHSEYVTLIAFHCNNGYTNTPQCYVIRAFSSLVFVSPKAVRNARIVFHAVRAVCSILLGHPILLLLIT